MKKGAIAGIIVAGILIFSLYLYLDSKDDTIQIEEKFRDKVVYTTNQDVDIIPLKADCKNRGGIFNLCGSPCSENAEACIAVCAYTCEIYGPEEKCGILNNEINKMIESTNYCENDEDCYVSPEISIAPFCNRLINRNADVSQIKNNLEQYIESCIETLEICPNKDREAFRCVDRKCI